MSRTHIHSLIAEPQAEPHPALERVGDDGLMAYLLDKQQVWWRRETIARFWRETLPAACVSPLIELVMDSTDTTEVRVAVLDALCSVCKGAEKAQLLTWLQGHSGKEEAYRLEERLLGARVKLGDITVIKDLARLAHDPWAHKQTCGIEGVQTLLVVHGHAAVLRELGYVSYKQVAKESTRADLRMLAIREIEAAGADLSGYLADPDRSIARYVFDALSDKPLDKVSVGELAQSRAAGEETRCWAILALLRSGETVDALIGDLKEPIVLLPGVPAAIRSTLVRAYAPGQRRTDPRWLLEHAMSHSGERVSSWDDAPSAATIADLSRLVDALNQRGLKPSKPMSSGDSMQQGAGSYFVVNTKHGPVYASTLGPFASNNEGDDLDGQTKVKAAAQDAGLTWIDNELGATTFEGLCVYFFGDREPLTVRELLFYWQD